MLKRFAWLLLFVVFLLFVVIVTRTFTAKSQQMTVQLAPPLTLDETAAAQRLAGALRFVTIASADHPDQNADTFVQLHSYMQNAYPLVYRHLKLEPVGTHSLLFTWQGSDARAQPILLMAHQDVVPIAPGTEGNWLQPPFAGKIADTYIWGRGSWDDKGNLFSQLEAAEKLLSEEFQPRQSIYLAFGADEEVGGERGAKKIAALLKSRGVHFDFILDEGMLVTEGIMQGLDQAVALIGVAEKGYATVNLNVETAPGHSSMPPPHTAIGMMSTALSRLESQPFPAKIDGVAGQMFDTLAPEMHWPYRVLFSNLWLFRPLVKAQMEKTASTNAMLRTTTALTIFHAGNQDNVLPGKADATVNFRTLPGDTEGIVLQHIADTVQNPAIKTNPGSFNIESSAVASTQTPAYQTLHRTIREIFANTVVVPGLVVGATDSRHFAELSNNIFKFSPVRARQEDLARFHGTNERIGVKNYVEMIHFYHQLLRNASAQSSGK